MSLRIRCDGASRGNPGPAGAGVVIESGDKTVDELKEYLGVMTNNAAEYRALILGLNKAIELGAREVEVLSDSELMVKQLKGEYAVKNPDLKVLYAEARRGIDRFESFRVRHVPRGENSRADRLANEAIDEATGKGAAAREWKRYVQQLGMGVDLHGQDPTKSARRAVADAISRGSLPGLIEIHGLDLDDVLIEVEVAVPNPGAVIKEEVLEELPFGRKKIEVREGGMTVSTIKVERFGDRTDEILVANAVVTVLIPS